MRNDNVYRVGRREISTAKKFGLKCGEVRIVTCDGLSGSCESLLESDYEVDAYVESA